MGIDVASRLRRPVGIIFRPLIPIVQSLFGMTREAARKAIIWFLEKAIIAVVLSVVGGAGFFAIFQKQLFEKADKDQQETLKRLDKLERAAVGKGTPQKGVSDLQSGSTVPDEARARAEAECKVQKAKDVAALTRQRQDAFSAYENCLADYRPTWSTDPPARQYCGPKLNEHMRVRQAVIDREARDCALAAK